MFINKKPIKSGGMSSTYFDDAHEEYLTEPSFNQVNPAIEYIYSKVISVYPTRKHLSSI